MKLKSYLFFFSVLFAHFVSAQSEQAVIKARILDPDNKAVPFANVALYKSTDSTLVKGDASDLEGKVSLSAPKGNYYLTISFLSFKTKTLSNIALKQAVVDLGNIKLQSNSQLLDEVEVTAERSQMELKLDKRIFNVGKDLSNVGSNAAEILDNIPSVQVDVEGNVSLRGSQNVRVLIDGKPSSIVAGNIGDALRQFQGNLIERVEVITNPSARYDAEGEVGIINIVLKKDKKKGLNGSVEAVAGYPENFRGSFNLNYRQKNVNLFTSVGVAYRNSPGGGETFQRFNSPDTAYLYTIDNDRRRGGLSNNFRLGSDIFLNDLNTITIAGFYRFSDEKNVAELTYRDLFGDGRLFQEVFREDKESEDGENLETSINYTKKFNDHEDHKFTIDLQWSERDDLEESDITETNFRTNDILLQESSNLEYNRNYLIQSDYIHPVGENGLFETGFRTSLRTVENDFQVRESTDGSSFEVLPDFNNNFIYKEDIYAAYLMFGNERKHFSYQFGLRAEYSDISTELKLSEQTNRWEYLNFFPSANLTYEFENKDNIQLSYSRRINRPRFRYLLPFSNFTDARNFYAGNPNLQPEYTDSYELGYLKYFEKGSLFSSVYYRYRTGVIDRITTTDQDGFTIRIPVNLAIEHNIGYEINGNYKFSKKTSVNANANLYRSQSSGTYEGLILENTAFVMSGRMMIRTELPREINSQVSLNYRAPRRTNQGRVKALYSFDLSFSKDILKGKGTLVASVRDLLNSRVYRSVVDDRFLFRESDFQWRVRQFLLSFNYRINKKKSRGRGGENGDYGGDDF